MMFAFLARSSIWMTSANQDAAVGVFWGHSREAMLLTTKARQPSINPDKRKPEPFQRSQNVDYSPKATVMNGDQSDEKLQITSDAFDGFGALMPAFRLMLRFDIYSQDINIMTPL
jgi:hypothetical protein